MMSNRRTSIVLKVFVLILAGGIFGQLATNDSLVAQSSSRTQQIETPDPYFSQSPISARERSTKSGPASRSATWNNSNLFPPANRTKPIKVPTAQPRQPSVPADLWTHPNAQPSKLPTFSKSLFPPVSKQPSVGWDAPRTQLPAVTRASYESSGETNFTAGDGNVAFPQPISTFEPNSIIRESGGATIEQNPQPSHTSPTKTQPSTKRQIAKAFEPGRVLALVGGEPIFVGDLMFEINQVIEKFIGGAPEKIKMQRRKEMIPQVLPRFVEAKMLYLGAMRELPEGIDIAQALGQAHQEFDKNQLKKVVKNSGLKSRSEFDAYLRSQGSSIRKLRDQWSQEQLTKYYLSKQLNIDSDVTHQEMLDTYRKNIESYAIPARCRWEQVMIRFDRSKSRAAAKQKVVKLGNDIVYGANLSAVAKKDSHGYLAPDGGQHDWTTQGALVLTTIDKSIFSLPIDELSDIIESRDGFHVVRVLERTEATRTPFLEAQVEIKNQILNEKRKKAFDEHLKMLKREIPVEYYLNKKFTPPL